TRHRWSAQNHEVDEILRKENIQRPIERHSELLFQSRQLGQIDRPPQKPRDESREVYPENLGYTGPPTDCREAANRRKHKWLPPTPEDGGFDVLGHSPSLPHRVLCGGRVGVARSRVGNYSAVPQGPHARPSRNLHVFVDDKSPTVFLAWKRRQNRIRRSSGCPHQGFRLDSSSIAQFDASL